jgi:8-oxo-dGTP pyrophosphatase MutT (NUDIX family)
MSEDKGNASKDRDEDEGEEMSFKPQDFFIGMMDFFSILMPGALMSYLVKNQIAFWAGKGGTFPLNNAENDLIFLFSAYLLGHFIFLIGSHLDDLMYNPIRSWTYRHQIKKLSEGKRLSYKWCRKLAQSKWLFGKNPDAAVMRAEISKAESLGPHSASSAVNAFQWSKARLSMDHPEGLATVQRFEADSKFFRSFIIVLVPAGIVVGAHGHWPISVICGCMWPLALWRYIEQRFKSTQHAYWNVLTFDAAKNHSTAPSARKGSLTHAGGVVYRLENGTAKYLLVESNDKKHEWVLPKGHIEPGEGPGETAVREVREESGIWAGVVKWIGDFDFRSGAGTTPVRFFLMELKEEGGKEPPEVRKSMWAPHNIEKEKGLYPETVEILKQAEAIRISEGKKNRRRSQVHRMDKLVEVRPA